MGKRKYNAPDNPDNWVPILSKKEVKNNCTYFVLSKVIAGCINIDHVKKWLKGNILYNCNTCKYFEEKIDEKKEKEQRKTKRVKKQREKGESGCKEKDTTRKKKTRKTKKGRE